MRITFVMRKFGNVERNSHCDVLHITPIRVARLFLDCNGDFAIKAYTTIGELSSQFEEFLAGQSQCDGDHDQIWIWSWYRLLVSGIVWFPSQYYLVLPIKHSSSSPNACFLHPARHFLPAEQCDYYLNYTGYPWYAPHLSLSRTTNINFQMGKHY